MIFQPVTFTPQVTTSADYSTLYLT